jgi:hypothetical protein
VHYLEAWRVDPKAAEPRENIVAVSAAVYKRLKQILAALGLVIPDYGKIHDVFWNIAGKDAPRDGGEGTKCGNAEGSKFYIFGGLYYIDGMGHPAQVKPPDPSLPNSFLDPRLPEAGGLPSIALQAGENFGTYFDKLKNAGR